MIRVAVWLESVETVVVMPKRDSGEFRELCSKNGIVWNATELTGISKDWRRLINYVIRFPAEVIGLMRVFKDEGIVLVHVSGGSWQYKGVLGARLAGIPVIWHLNDTWMPGPIRIAFRAMRRMASGFIFASHRSRSYYGDSTDYRPHAVIPAVVDVDHFKPERKAHYRGAADLGLGKSEFVVGTVANINPVKGVETLIEALRILRQQFDGVQLVVVGPVFQSQEPYYQELVSLAQKQRVADAIHWAGPQSDVRPWLQRMDVYVCSSRAESSPTAVWEAMAMECPVVSTDVGDVPRYIVNGENGYVEAVGDADAIATRVGGLLCDYEMRRRFGKKSRSIAVSNFSVRRVAKATERFYSEVLEYALDGNKKEK